MSSGPRRLTLFTVAAILGIGAWLCLGPEERIAYLLFDDAYYYLGVAQHMAQGVGSTFDGINASNGYHPLWCWLLVPLYLVVDDPGLAVRIVGLLWFGLAAAAALAVGWMLRPRSGPLAAALAALLFGLHPTLGLSIAHPNGLETPLYAVLIAVFAGLWERFGARLQPATDRSSRLALLALGAVLGLVVLARLDGGMLAVAAALLLLGREARQAGLMAGLRAVALLTLGAVIVAGPSLAWNTVRFGSPVPISQRALHVWSESTRESLGGPGSIDFWRRRAWHGVESIPIQMGRAGLNGAKVAAPIWRLGKVAGAGLLAGTALLVFGAIRTRRRRLPAAGGAATGDALTLLALFGALHYAAYVAWFWTGGEKGYRLYYFMPQVMLVAAALGTLLGAAMERITHGRTQAGTRTSGRWLGPLLGAACVAWLAFLVGATRAELREVPAEPGSLAERRLYGWVRTNLPAAAVVATTDAGRLGYFCGRPTVNLDGLINDERFLEALATHKVPEYVCASPITHLVTGIGALHGFDPARPEIPPTQRDFLGDLLYGVGRVPGCSVRSAGSVENWLIFAVDRTPPAGSRVALSRDSQAALSPGNR